MESVDAIAQKLIPCTCGGYGENNRRHMSDCPRFFVAWEDIAAALRAERENTDAANAAAVNAYAKVRELEALLDGAKSALAAERAKFAAFADKNGEPRKVPLTADGKLIVEPSEVWWWDGDVLRGGGAAMTFEIAFATDVVDVFTSPNAGIGAVYSTKQAAEAAKEKTQ